MSACTDRGQRVLLLLSNSASEIGFPQRTSVLRMDLVEEQTFISSLSASLTGSCRNTIKIRFCIQRCYSVRNLNNLCVIVNCKCVITVHTLYILVYTVKERQIN